MVREDEEAEGDKTNASRAEGGCVPQKIYFPPGTTGTREKSEYDRENVRK